MISVPHEGAERGCIFRHPSTTISAYLSTVSLRQEIAPDRIIDEGNKRNRRPPCDAYARDGTAGPDMAITGVDSWRGWFQAQALPRRLPSALRSRPEFSTTGWSTGWLTRDVYRPSLIRRGRLSNARVAQPKSVGYTLSVENGRVLVS